MEDLSKLTKAELIARLTATEADEPNTPSIGVADLMKAIVAAQGAAAHPPVTEEQKYRVVNGKALRVAFECADPRTGQMKQYALPKQNDFVMLSLAEIRNLQQQFPSFFEEGYLVVPELDSMGANAILDFEKFIASIKYTEVDERIAEISSLNTLYGIFNHIESQRFVTTDEHGRPLTEGPDNTLTVKEVKLPALKDAISRAVKFRIESMSDVRVNLDGK